ncbi:MAG TPA: energy transducer TonB [Candidatus Sulfotelmatobacter sp.]|nr:energy transducer TonB [Candidatus Sulfotelmatobacter sp.]
MKTHKLLSALAALILFGSVDALAAEVKVIANRSIRADSIAAVELREVFLQDRKSLSDGSHVEPVLAKEGAAHETFLNQYLGKSSDALRNYYRTMVFTGTGAMPKSFASDREIVAYVAKTNGAIGYVDIDTPVEGVKILTISNAGGKGERMLLTRVEPEYPETLQKLGIGGSVRLRISISPKGGVGSVAVLGGNPIFVEAAVKAVKQWVYAPSPSQTTIEVTIPFQPRP